MSIRSRTHSFEIGCSMNEDIHEACSINPDPSHNNAPASDRYEAILSFVAGPCDNLHCDFFTWIGSILQRNQDISTVISPRAFWLISQPLNDIELSIMTFHNLKRWERVWENLLSWGMLLARRRLLTLQLSTLSHLQRRVQRTVGLCQVLVQIYIPVWARTPLYWPIVY